jgi:hypothetical protein
VKKIFKKPFHFERKICNVCKTSANLRKIYHFRSLHSAKEYSLH